MSRTFQLALEIRGYSPVERPRWGHASGEGGINISRERKGRVESRLSRGWEGPPGHCCRRRPVLTDPVLGVDIPADRVGTVPRSHVLLGACEMFVFYKAEEEMNFYFIFI